MEPTLFCSLSVLCCLHAFDGPRATTLVRAVSVLFMAICILRSIRKSLWRFYFGTQHTAQRRRMKKMNSAESCKQHMHKIRFYSFCKLLSRKMYVQNVDVRHQRQMCGTNDVVADFSPNNHCPRTHGMDRIEDFSIYLFQILPVIKHHPKWLLLRNEVNLPKRHEWNIFIARWLMRRNGKTLQTIGKSSVNVDIATQLCKCSGVCLAFR